MDFYRIFINSHVYFTTHVLSYLVNLYSKQIIESYNSILSLYFELIIYTIYIIRTKHCEKHFNLLGYHRLDKHVNLHANWRQLIFNSLRG